MFVNKVTLNQLPTAYIHVCRDLQSLQKVPGLERSSNSNCSVFKSGAGKKGVPENISCKLFISWLKKSIVYLVEKFKVTKCFPIYY